MTDITKCHLSNKYGPLYLMFPTSDYFIIAFPQEEGFRRPTFELSSLAKKKFEQL